MGKSTKYKIGNFFEIQYSEDLIQEIFAHLLPKEINSDFLMLKTSYIFRIFNFKRNFYRHFLFISSTNKKKYYLPYSFYKRSTNKKVEIPLLLKLSMNKFASSWIINFYASLWLSFAIILSMYLLFVGLHFYMQPVQISEPQKISFSDLRGNEYIGEIVEVEGFVDYSLALIKEEVSTNSRGNVTLLTREVYLPLFSPDEASEIIVIRGGSADIANITGRIGTTNADLLKNQPYTAIGRIERIGNSLDEINNNYLNPIIKSRALNPPQLIINSANIISLESFLNQYINFFLLITLLFLTSLGLNIYLDRIISTAKNK
jgi:hypothetical protein